MTNDKKPKILLLSLNKQSWFDNMYIGLLKAIAARAEIVEATSVAALPKLSPSVHSAVFITDEAITERKHAAVLSQIVDYTRAGGTVVIGGLFSSFVKLDTLDAHFLCWGLSWKAAGYRRSPCVLSRATHPGFRSNGRLPASYSMKAVSLKGLAPEDIMYKREEGEGEDEDKVTSRLPEEATVAYARLGSGYLGYIGDVNAEEDSISVVLAMCGLPV
jgi:hypothetical protein